MIVLRCVDCGADDIMTESERQDVSTWYESQIGGSLSQSGLPVQSKPRINDKTPDLLFSPPNGPECVVECTVMFQDPEHDRELSEQNWHTCGGGIQELNANIYSRLEKKMLKYRGYLDDRAYIVAVRNEMCMSFLKTAFDLAFGAYVQSIGVTVEGQISALNWTDAWSTPEQPAGLLVRYPHCSGIIYSVPGGNHYFIPNPLQPYRSRPTSSNLLGSVDKMVG